MNSVLVPYLITTVGVRTAFDIVEVGLRTINNTTRAITEISSHSHPKTNKDLKQFLHRLDLVFKLDIIRKFLMEIDRVESQAVHFGMDGINEMLLEIERVTAKIQRNVEYNRSLYLRYFFKIDHTDSINQLEHLVNTLFGRFHMMCVIHQSLKGITNPL
jgi:hypothetical protein